jgi:glycerol kinase
MPTSAGPNSSGYLDHVEGARARAERGELAFGTVDRFLAWRLSGGQLHLTDVSNACRTMLFGLHRAEWSSDILERLNIPPQSCPEVMPSEHGSYGETAGS